MPRWGAHPAAGRTARLRIGAGHAGSPQAVAVGVRAHRGERCIVLSEYTFLAEGISLRLCADPAPDGGIRRGGQWGGVDVLCSTRRAYRPTRSGRDMHLRQPWLHLHCVKPTHFPSAGDALVAFSIFQACVRARAGRRRFRSPGDVRIATVPGLLRFRWRNGRDTVPVERGGGRLLASQGRGMPCFVVVLVRQPSCAEDGRQEFRAPSNRLLYKNTSNALPIPSRTLCLLFRLKRGGRTGFKCADLSSAARSARAAERLPATLRISSWARHLRLALCQHHEFALVLVPPVLPLRLLLMVRWRTGASSPAAGGAGRG
ncbi:hypothetical protein B0H10DRAFT_253842 [Mycena sp. CBHHK59/15]|nr:hypothetical protein B0H10DRAFT_253842 [Mycena sp. CBHHK59/15]